MQRCEIQIRDPFILTETKTNDYYLYGTTDKNCWGDKGVSLECYHSTDLEEWDGPYTAFAPDKDFWADRHFWAPEVYNYNGNYYMFASFKSPDKCRGTQILKSDSPKGPFVPITDEPVTPRNWECLDGTLFIDDENKPWIVFCHEWTQVIDGEMVAMRLSDDFTSAVGEPVKLFSASEAEWTKGSVHKMDGSDETVYVTDGPFLYRTEDGQLLMMWSSGSKNGYAIGIARSASGKIDGSWTHDKTMLFDSNGGHGMIFKSLDGKIYITLHSPNKTPNERPCFFEVEEVSSMLKLK